MLGCMADNNSIDCDQLGGFTLSRQGLDTLQHWVFDSPRRHHCCCSLVLVHCRQRGLLLKSSTAQFHLLWLRDALRFRQPVAVQTERPAARKYLHSATAAVACCCSLFFGTTCCRTGKEVACLGAPVPILTCCSSVLVRKQVKACTKLLPHGPALRSATHGQASASSAFL